MMSLSPRDTRRHLEQWLPRLGEALWGLSRALKVGGRGAHVLSAEMLNDIRIGQDVLCQLLLLLCGLEDQAPFAEPDDVFLHQVQVHCLHELLGRQMPGRVSSPLTATPRDPSPPLN